MGAMYESGLALKWRKKAKVFWVKNWEFLEKFWSFREFLEWFVVFWTDLE